MNEITKNCKSKLKAKVKILITLQLNLKARTTIMNFKKLVKS